MTTETTNGKKAPITGIMRVVVHDCAGHPFQVHLSRALASRGHEVLHLH